jgi:hypothetical protein
VYLLIADTELPGHLLLGHAGQQAELLDSVAEESIKFSRDSPDAGSGKAIIYRFAR